MFVKPKELREKGYKREGSYFTVPIAEDIRCKCLEGNSAVMIVSAFVIRTHMLFDVWVKRTYVLTDYSGTLSHEISEAEQQQLQVTAIRFTNEFRSSGWGREVR